MPSFLDQARLERLLREVYRRTHREVHGAEPEPEQLAATVQREIPLLQETLGEDFLLRLTEPQLPRPERPPDLPEDGSFTFAWLTPAQRQEAESALWYAKLHGIDSIVAVLEWHRVCNRAALEAPPLRACIDRFLVAKRSERLAPLTVRNYALRLERFAARFGDRLPGSVTAQELNGYLEAWPQPTTRASHWLTVAALFTWLLRQRYILRHPFGEGARPPPRKPSARVIFTPEETATILRSSLERDTAGYWALSLFAGLRACELQRLQELADPWAAVDWKQGTLDLSSPRVAARPNRRKLKLVPCALAWLRWMKERNVPFFPANSWEKVGRMRARILAVRTASSAAGSVGTGLQKKAHGLELNGQLVYGMARRSYLSYRLALEEGGPTGSALVADEVGLTERLLRADYAGKAARAEALRYFALAPKALGEPVVASGSGD
ncbi:MAG: hypothetical protein C0518_00870 [Opitutus sp.]|nr:hypothetical protein [Opitutus sp.]